MRKYWYALGVVFAGAMALVVMAPATALAANVLTLGSVGGAAVSVGDTLSAGLMSGTTANFTSTAGGSTGIFCSVSSFAGTVSTNPTAPGTATGAVTAQNFTSCTDTIFGATVQSVTLNNLPYNLSVTSGFVVTVSAGAAGPIQTTIRLNTLLGATTCVYRANGGTVIGTASNTGNTITFTNAQFNKFSGPGTCFNNGFFSATYGPVLDTSQPGTPPVFVN